MGVAVELVVVFLLFCLAASEGLPWTILFVPAYLGWLIFKFPAIGKRIPFNRTFLLFLFLFVLITLGVGTVVYDMLSNAPESLAESPLFDFLAGPAILKLFWSTVMGGFVAFDLLASVLIVCGYYLARGKYGDFEQYEHHKVQATTAAIFGILGLSQGMVTVSQGKAEVAGGPGGSLARFGGPGEMIVQEGHAVILERNGRVSNVVGSGLTFLRGFERVSMVVPLHTRLAPIVERHLATRDKVLIEEFEFLVFHRVDRGPELSQIRDGQYSYNRDILLNMVWSPSGGDWQKAVESISGRAARDVMGRYDLVQVFPLTEAMRVEFNRQLMAQINSITIRALGVEIVAVDTGKILVPRQTEEHLVSQWMADWEQKVSATRAETEQLLQLSKTTARMQAIQGISQGLKQLLGPTANPEDYIALRYIEYLEHRDESSAGIPEDDVNTLLRLQGLETLRSLRPAHEENQGNNGPGKHGQHLPKVDL